jgi:hypothetical protein
MKHAFLRARYFVPLTNSGIVAHAYVYASFLEGGRGMLYLNLRECIKYIG